LWRRALIISLLCGYIIDNLKLLIPLPSILIQGNDRFIQHKDKTVGVNRRKLIHNPFHLYKVAQKRVELLWKRNKVNSHPDIPKAHKT
jgi:hypothetical protein